MTGSLGTSGTRVETGPGWELRLGRWQDVLADVTECDAVITDPPYSERTHAGQRTGSSLRMPTIGYGGITESDARWLAAEWAHRGASWAVVFCDHVAFGWHERAWTDAGWLAFAPVFLKPNPTPRFSGDGPAFALEFMLCARRRSGKIKPGSLPAFYEHQIGGNRKTRTVSGAKPIGLMRAIVRDYSRPGDLIVDPYAGGGTTLLAAAMEGRRAIGAEVDPDTFGKAVARLRKGIQPGLFNA